MKIIFITLLLFLSQGGMSKNIDTVREARHEQSPQAKDKELVETKIQIAEMTARDQAIRFEILKSHKDLASPEIKHLAELMTKIDEQNVVQLKKLLARWGWPTKELFGEQYCHDVWLLTQHADNDVAFQEKALKDVHEVMSKDPSEKTNYAYLLDRVKIHQGLPQVYGTQGKCIKAHEWQPFKIKDEHNINKTRASANLPSFESYRKQMNEYCF